MGVIDKTTYILNCPICNEDEVGSILDKGSNWSGSHWQSSADFKKFKTSWSGGGITEPSLISATCTSCGQSAGIKRC
jgi:hypothetical protein